MCVCVCGVQCNCVCARVCMFACMCACERGGLYLSWYVCNSWLQVLDARQQSQSSESIYLVVALKP